MGTVIKANFNWSGQGDLLARCNLEKGGKVQQVIDKAVIDYDLQYVPMQSGTLGKSAYTATQIGSGRVVYNTPYARYLYYGQAMGPNIPVFEDDTGIPTRYFSRPGEKKHLTGKPLEYSKEMNPLAGSFWFERMKADHMKDILKEAQNVAGKH